MRPTVLPRMRPLISSQHDDRPGTSSGTVPYDLHGRTIRLQAQGFPLLPQPPARANRFYSSHADEAVVEEVDAQRVHGEYERVHAQVELEAVDQEGAVQVPLGHLRQPAVDVVRLPG